MANKPKKTTEEKKLTYARMRKISMHLRRFQQGKVKLKMRCSTFLFFLSLFYFIFGFSRNARDCCLFHIYLHSACILAKQFLSVNHQQKNPTDGNQAFYTSIV